MHTREQLRQFATLMDHTGLGLERFAEAWNDPRSIADRAAFRRWGKEMLQELDQLAGVVAQPPISTREWSEDLGVAIAQLRQVLPFMMLAAADTDRPKLPQIDAIAQHGRNIRELAQRLPHIPMPAG